MTKYKIRFKQSITKDLRTIPKHDVQRILEKIDWLSENPRGEGCIKLSGQEYYRVRQGIYRIIYEILDDILVINLIKIAHRSSVYKNF
jgi:mRNA interferase RelE/StbE